MNNNDSIRISVGGDTVFVNKDDFKVGNRESKNKQRRRKRGPRNPQPKEWLASNLSQMKIADYKPFNFVDGEGIRCSLYVSGCMFACPGCYNKAAQNFNYGTPYTQELEDRIIKDLGESYCQGLTLLGGEPFLNTQVCLKLVKRIRKEYGHEKDIWSWSGYTWDELMQESEDKLELLSNLDILVDGRFEQDLMDLTLQFRGSSNQRIIDVQRSLKEGQVVIWDKLMK
ncbi:anaerobic ribonucleoside-triphosphate reductase activating protein [Ligilactobacillus salivarius]|uniref:anaerobic ribonucleoside-triphosphate reductase activating protein n=1 Tax=Ligilactobacillus salivarius TaxID=1624 RepID=UPI000BAFD892|nr:anaerobic ribonucleoside-triphosphate reductase activating protein [Ligilactobacillus salivarius]MBE7387483.1 anaerobic ribonucleoside-triphosphate reductase activating protein [Ligilactobacillus salivarius]MBE7391897.1 anaerobic ribonucleoside-triphosphate reductase activating protein [Ligilactobacillus salivarius]PAY33162.1 anaerobic ribonucleoside-triphosphate reductase activating protein [Ligilactobacillus salivarius]PAY38117.1 anaerobic ribonucleoside-triphosphate reductase activating p